MPIYKLTRVARVVAQNPEDCAAKLHRWDCDVVFRQVQRWRKERGIATEVEEVGEMEVVDQLTS